MKIFWWTEDDQLMATNDNGITTNLMPYQVRELLDLGYAEVSVQTARALGWPV